MECGLVLSGLFRERVGRGGRGCAGKVESDGGGGAAEDGEGG